MMSTPFISSPWYDELGLMMGWLLPNHRIRHDPHGYLKPCLAHYHELAALRNLVSLGKCSCCDLGAEMVRLPSCAQGEPGPADEIYGIHVAPLVCQKNC